jgi:DNA-binding NarL/FixJ family response regulator
MMELGLPPHRLSGEGLRRIEVMRSLAEQYGFSASPVEDENGEITLHLRVQPTATGARDLIGHLNIRQRAVAEMIAQGKSNKTIALESGMALPTVKAHVKAIFTRLGVSRRAEIVPLFPLQAVRATDAPKLGSRELQIADLLAEGKCSKVIAQRLGIAEATVKVYLKSLYIKLRVSNRTEAAAVWLAMRVGGHVPAEADAAPAEA